MLKIKSKEELESLLKKLKSFSKKIKVLSEEYNIPMHDKDSTFHINSTGTLFDVEEVKADKLNYQIRKMGEDGQYY